MDLNKQCSSSDLHIGGGISFPSLSAGKRSVRLFLALWSGVGTAQGGAIFVCIDIASSMRTVFPIYI
jgi:hypothetical protein